MKMLQFYKFAALGLFILNLARIAFFLMTKPKPRPPQHNNNTTRAFLPQAIKMLHLNEEQEAFFNQSAKAHNQKMEAITKQQQKLLVPYFQTLTDSSKNIDTAMVLSQFQQLEVDKITSTHQHFQDVKSILKPEQQPDFKSFMNKALDILLFNKKKNPPPPKDF